MAVSLMVGSLLRLNCTRSSARRAHPAPSLRPRHFTPRPGGDRSADCCAASRRERRFSSLVLAVDHAFGALIVRPLTYRTLLFDDELGFQFGNPRFECGDHVADRPVTARWPRGQGLVRSMAAKALSSLLRERGRRWRLTMARAASAETLRRSPI